MTGSDSARVAQLIPSDFTAAGNEQDVIVFDSKTLTIKDSGYTKVVSQVLAAVRDEPGVVALTGPTDPGAQGQVSKDGHAALASVGLSGNDRERATRASHLQDVVAAAAGNGSVQAYLTGYSRASNNLVAVETADTDRAESIGIPIALVVLLFALAAVVAGLIPLAMALISLLATFGVLSGAGHRSRTIDSFLLSIVTMLGSRDLDRLLPVHLEPVPRGTGPRPGREGRARAGAAAVGIAMATSGKTILFSGTSS